MIAAIAMKMQQILVLPTFGRRCDHVLQDRPPDAVSAVIEVHPVLVDPDRTALIFGACEPRQRIVHKRERSGVSIVCDPPRQFGL